jgi:CheY-like chemotaxis protein
VEITEGLSMQAPHRTLEFIRQLRTLGVGVAIDDFGTGFSNLSYLKRFPVNKLKLDYSFVNGIASNPEDIAISTAIIEMGHSLHLKVIAEGVERASQLAILAARGCDQLQGYLFSPPLTADDFAALVRSGRRLSVPHSGKPQTQPTLLIVDDDRLALSSLRRALTAQPYRVLLVAGAAQAFELLATQRVDVLLSDHRMPEMNGLEFLEKVRHMYPGIVRLMLSGFAEQDLLLNAINQRTLFKFLCKPWTTRNSARRSKKPSPWPPRRAERGLRPGVPSAGAWPANRMRSLAAKRAEQLSAFSPSPIISTRAPRMSCTGE